MGTLLNPANNMHGDDPLGGILIELVPIEETPEYKAQEAAYRAMLDAFARQRQRSGLDVAQ